MNHPVIDICPIKEQVQHSVKHNLPNNCRKNSISSQFKSQCSNNSNINMNRNLSLFLLIVAVVLLVAATTIDAECRWLDCHAHSAGDWCNILGPGWKVKNWRRCNGLLGKSEHCCK